MNTPLIARLVAAAFAAVTTSSLLLAMVWLGQPGTDAAEASLARQAAPVVVARTDGP